MSSVKSTRRQSKETPRRVSERFDLSSSLSLARVAQGCDWIRSFRVVGGRGNQSVLLMRKDESEIMHVSVGIRGRCEYWIRERNFRTIIEHDVVSSSQMCRRLQQWGMHDFYQEVCVDSPEGQLDRALDHLYRVYTYPSPNAKRLMQAQKSRLRDEWPALHSALQTLCGHYKDVLRSYNQPTESEEL